MKGNETRGPRNHVMVRVAKARDEATRLVSQKTKKANSGVKGTVSGYVNL
jgi:hypothetical protein